MDSNTPYSNNAGSASGIGYFQTSWPGIPGHLTDTPCRADQVLTQQHLDRHQNRCLENLSQFFTNLDNVSDDVRKITAMSPAEVRTFLSHGDSWVDEQMLNSLFEAMQGLENQLYHLRVLNIPFALAAPESSLADQGVTFQPESSDDESYKLPIDLSPSRPPTPDDSPARALDLLPDNNTPKASPIREAVPVARARRHTCQATRKRGAINRELQIPESLNQILDDIISSGTRQREQSGYLEDLISCYSRLNDCATGKDIVELLHAVLLSQNEAEACTDLFKLQQRIAGDELPITVYQLRDLESYLRSQVFNGKKVNFNLEDMGHYLKLSAKQKFLDYVPALARLVSYLIETTLSLRDTEKVALKRRFFLKQLQQSSNGRLAIKLLNAIVLTPPDCTVIREVLIEVTDTDNKAAVRKVSVATINLLRKFLTDHFFNPWLLDFRGSDLNNVTEEAVPRKLRRGARGERLPRSTNRYEFDPTYIAPGMG